VSPVAMSLLLLAGFGVFAVSAYRRWCLLAVATPAARFDRIGRRLAATWRYAFAQERMRRYWWAGVAHLAIFSGFVVLLLRSLILWGRGYSEGFDFWLFGLDQPFGKIYALLKDIFVVLVILGTLVFVYYRAVRKLTRMTLSTEGLIILGIILTMMVSDVLYDGANHVRAAQATGAAVHFNPWEPVGSGVGLALSPWGLSGGAINVLRHLGFWTHAGLVLVFLNILPYSKHFHIITAIPNVFFQDLDPPGRLAPTEDLEGKVEREETLGIARIEQFSWKAVLDFFTCTECGRCTDFCPAANTGKLLSPKQFTIDLRDHLYSRQDEFIAARRNGHSGAASAVGRRPDRNGCRRIDQRARHRTGRAGACDHQPEVLWACTTCRACEQECPVFISYVDKIRGHAAIPGAGERGIPQRPGHRFSRAGSPGQPVGPARGAASGVDRRSGGAADRRRARCRVSAVGGVRPGLRREGPQDRPGGRPTAESCRGALRDLGRGGKLYG
jgi:NAD-dependent dihydropyrimidine dehydrogenase PreA subunit